MPMKSVSADVKFSPKSPRVELLVRIVWGIVGGIVLGIFSFVAFVIWAIQILHILFYARRHKGMQSFIKTVVVARYRLSAYLFLLTDERPPIIPESMPA
ncbi:MAG TPA: DUF4389 domain-containing protein [archaeon]|nr:DUF4389 domain-containing protein [archaeon]